MFPRTTVMNINGDKLYPYILPNFITRFFNNINIFPYLEDNFYKFSPIKDFLSQNKSLKFNIVDGTSLETKSRKVEYGGYRPYEFATHSFLKFLNLKDKFNNRVSYTCPIFSDSSSL